jgi:hypothetical protein
MDTADIATIAIAVLALLSTIGSFWWLNARRGSLSVVVPQSYAFVQGFRLRFAARLLQPPLDAFATG